MIESKNPTKQAPGSRRGRKWSLFGMLALAALIAIVAVVFLSGTFRQELTQVYGDPEAPGSAEQSDSPSAEPGDQGNEGTELGVPTRGDEGAPVVMVEYGDFQCPNCGKFAREVEPELVEKYVESGAVRMEWRDFPYLGQESVNAALAARAAQEQGMFWEYHDLLYQIQGSLNSGTLSDETLISLARELGLDVEQFEESFTSGKYEAVVGKDLEEGAREGIPGTPTFFINGRVVAGTQATGIFEEAIEEAAREAEDA